MFVPIKFKTTIQLNPSEMDHEFENHILKKLQDQYEGVCSRYGYIKPGSIHVIERSLGQLMKPHFNGHIRFEMNLIAEVCNPSEGMIISATVKNKNQLGILAESIVHIDDKRYSVLDIIIPKRTSGISSEIGLEGLQVGDSIYVEILGKRYQLNDKKISIIGRGVSSMKPTKRVHQDVMVYEETTQDEVDGDGDGEADMEDSELSTDSEQSEDEGEEEKIVKTAEIPFLEEENPFASDDEEIEDDFDEEDDDEEEDDIIVGDYGDDA